MITFITISFILLVLLAILSIILMFGGAGIIVVFGDWIVFGLIAYALYRLIRFIVRKRRK